MQLCDKSYVSAETTDVDAIYDTISNDMIKNTLFAKTSVIILTANKYERNILHNKVFSTTNTNMKIKKVEIDLLTACDRFNKVYAYSFEWHGKTCLHIHANVTGSYTIGGAADIINWIKSNAYLFPTLIISFGICFGTNEKNYELGDVIISKKIYPYFIGAKVNGEELVVVDDNAFQIDMDLFNKISDLFNNNRFNKLNKFKVTFDNYLTGEAVVSSLKTRSTINSITTQNTPAGDMEGYGVFKECNRSDFKVPCLVIKSICDWGAEKNFDTSNETTIATFKSIVKSIPDSKTTDEIKQLVSTLKDRIQAYSVSCAFKVLDIMMQYCELKKSLLNELREWLSIYNGVSTTCKEIKAKAYEITNANGISGKSVDLYIHRCLMILDENDQIKCHDDCINDNVKDNCINKEQNAAVRINNRRKSVKT